MTIVMERRTLVRIISFILAALLVLAGLAWNWHAQAENSRRTLEYRYMQSVADLTSYAQNINTDLTKALYAKTPAMLSSLSAKLWREAGYAKNSLDTLPVDVLKLQNTNKFLSQVGDYSVSLSKEFAKGTPITKEQRDNLLKLHEYCGTMLSEVLAMEDALRSGSLSLSRTEDAAQQGFAETSSPADIAEGFSEFEEGFTSYPTLIYDGPFSDHILEKEPERLKNEAEVSRDVAKKKASKVSGVEIGDLNDMGDEEGRMPSYVFGTADMDISVTRQGGLLSYLLKSRLPGEQKLSPEDALASAQTFMKKLNIPTMAESYYEIADNVLTVNYAYEQDGVVVYPDLIKVGVALDNGEILSFDSRGFLVNHWVRKDVTPVLTEEKARGSVSELLTIDSSRLCIIPSDGLNEVLCWEFKCKSEDGQDILVYVNAATGAEERILILLIGENGQLTM